MKLSKTAQPAGVEMNVLFGSGTIEDLISRPAEVQDQSSVSVALYAYLGLGTVVGVTMSDPSVYCRAYAGSGASDWRTPPLDNASATTAPFGGR